jgi:glutathione synthase/RimK-type ligase-like ATP-grasp enzyme
MQVQIIDYSVYGNPKDPVSNQLLSQAFRQRGCDVRIVNLIMGAPIPPPVQGQVVRFDLRATQDWLFVCSIVDAMTAQTPCVFPDSGQLRAAEDKWDTCQVLITVGVPTPDTWLASQAPVLAGPIIVKPRIGWGGRGARILPTGAMLHAHPDLCDDRHIVQPFIEHQITLLAALTATRFIELLEDPGRLVEDARRRTHVLESAPGIEELARQALAATRLPVGTVDLIQGPAGPLVLEVNAAPCLTYPHLPRFDLAGPMADALLAAWLAS